MMEGSNYHMVAALDIGTKNSGYAFSTVHDFKMDSMKILTNTKLHGNRLSHITSTSLLLNKNKEFVLFGEEAENEYADICLDDRQDDYYFFRRMNFKKKLNKDMMLADVKGKCLPAYYVYGMVVHFIVQDLTEIINQMKIGIQADGIKWISVVSAELTDSDKLYMISCAEETGIPKDKFKLVTEAEAAFVYYQNLPERDNEPKLQDVIECMIVGLGGTVIRI